MLNEKQAEGSWRDSIKADAGRRRSAQCRGVVLGFGGPCWLLECPGPARRLFLIGCIHASRQAGGDCSDSGGGECRSDFFHFPVPNVCFAFGNRPETARKAEGEKAPEAGINGLFSCDCGVPRPPRGAYHKNSLKRSASCFGPSPRHADPGTTTRHDNRARWAVTEILSQALRQRRSARDH